MKQDNTVRCECGGQVAVGGVLNPLVDLAIEVVNGKPVVKTAYNKKRIVGYTGFCMKCRKEGQFVLA
jgi:hypothetical protein